MTRLTRDAGTSRSRAAGIADSAAPTHNNISRRTTSPGRREVTPPLPPLPPPSPPGTVIQYIFSTPLPPPPTIAENSSSVCPHHTYILCRQITTQGRHNPTYPSRTITRLWNLGGGLSLLMKGYVALIPLLLRGDESLYRWFLLTTSTATVSSHALRIPVALDILRSKVVV